MKPREPDQLAVRLPFLGIDAKGPTAIRIIGRAVWVLILAVAVSIIIVSISQAPGLPVWQALHPFFR
jgi:hypothetical protein